MAQKAVVVRCSDGGIHASSSPNHERVDKRHERLEDGPKVTTLTMSEGIQYRLILTWVRLAFACGSIFMETSRGVTRLFSTRGCSGSINLGCRHPI